MYDMVYKTNYMVQGILQRVEREISSWLTAQNIIEPVVVLERAALPEFGEYTTNVAMRYAKELGKNPLQLAEELAEHLEKIGVLEVAKTVAVKPGFVNFFLTTEAKVKHLETILQLGDQFGQNFSHKGEKWVIEHTSPNPNKAMHLGHLRNNLVGMSIVRLLAASGAEVTSDAVYNNRGIAIAKAMYGFLAHMKQSANAPTDVEYWFAHKAEWLTPEEKGVLPDLFITECYIKGENDLKANKEIETVVRQMVVDWEAGDEPVRALWEHVLSFAYTGINRTLARLGNHWDKVWYEHEHYEEGKSYVGQGLEAGVFQRLDDGAVLTDLEGPYGLPDTILLKQDGTSLYITQDIALTDKKKKIYGADKLVWVIGPEQSMALKQLFAVCEQLGIGRREDFTHVPYGYVGLRDATGAFQKMSSRAGTVVLIDDVIDEVKATIKARFEEEVKHEAALREDLSETLALGAVKFAFLKSDRTQELTFDPEQSVDVQGDSGMYVLYTYVRTQSILRKAGAVSAALEATQLPTALGPEAELARLLLYFEDVVVKATNDLSVHHVAQYLLELAGEFNRWYAKETILDGADKEAYRLLLVQAVAVTLQNALALLGVETVDEM